MALEELKENVEIHQTLGDNPNTDNNLSSEELKAKFDEAARILKAYLNGSVVPYINSLSEAVSKELDPTLTREDLAAQSKAVGDELKKYLLIDGTRAMTGNLQMDGHKITGLGDPTEDGDAVNKSYADDAFAPTGYSIGTYSGSSDDEINTFINEVYGGMEDKTCKFAVYNSNGGNLYGGVWVLFFYRSQADYGFVRASKYASDSTGAIEEKVRSMYKGTWLDWAYVNPFLGSGAEYKTAEYCDSKGVYQMYVNVGSLPNTSSKTITTAIPSDATVIKIDFVIKTGGGYWQPADTYSAISMSIKDGVITVTTTDDRSAFTGHVTVKYAK